MRWNEADIDARLAAMAEQVASGYGDASSALVGIQARGAWVARALNGKLARPTPLGSLNASFYRDDFDTRGLKRAVQPSDLPFDVDGAHILLVDDVLMTGRTIRAAMNELFDYGRPAIVRLGVLVDRGCRELPFAADATGLNLDLASDRQIKLTGPEPLQLVLR